MTNNVSKMIIFNSKRKYMNNYSKWEDLITFDQKNRILMITQIHITI